MDKEMNTERFEQLRSSVIEAGFIMTGELKPSCEHSHDIVTEPMPLQEIWAVCLESDEPELLAPRKLYLVKYGETGVWVRDENGETVICDKEDFLPLAFAPEVNELLAETA